jgi:hypothetical protein
MTLSDITAIAALIFGLSGLVLSISNFIRDRPKVVVTLQWDMTLADGISKGKQIGLITITNVGRRPIYISHTSLKMPKESPTAYLVIKEGIMGEKLSEGDRPKIYPVEYKGLEEFAKYWKGIRAQVSDSTGKVWLSKRNAIKIEPSWAKASHTTHSTRPLD